jgi:adenylate cyclase
MAGDGFEWRRIDRTAVKGREKGEFVYELLGEKGKTAEETLRWRDLYEEALDAYLDRRFDQAMKGFEATAKTRQRDKASGILRERAETYLKNPPPADWTGVFVQSQK